MKAEQTPSRLNRTHPGKTDTFVLDFANDAETIQDVFRPYFTETTATPSDPNMLYTLQRRILDTSVINHEEMEAGVAAILTGGAKGAAALAAANDQAADRRNSLEEENWEQARTALRDYTRTSALSAQIISFTDTALKGCSSPASITSPGCPPWIPAWR